MSKIMELADDYADACMDQVAGLRKRVSTAYAALEAEVTRVLFERLTVDEIVKEVEKHYGIGL